MGKSQWVRTVDSSIKSFQGGKILGPDWTVKLQKVVQAKLNDPLFLESKHATPIGFSKKWPGKILEFTDTSNFASFHSFLDAVFPLSIIVRRTKTGGTKLLLRQSFKGTVKDSTFIDFNEKYYYLWNNKKSFVTIDFSIATFNSEYIEGYAQDLLTECKNFYAMYTEEGKDEIKKYTSTKEEEDIFDALFGP